MTAIDQREKVVELAGALAGRNAGAQVDALRLIAAAITYLADVIREREADAFDCPRCGGNDMTGAHERWCDR